MIRNSRAGQDVASLRERLDLGAPEDTEWVRDGLCAQTDPEVFFPDKGESTRSARSVCAVCPVRAECLAYALDRNERFGVWGGLSERERRPLRGQVAAAAAASAVDRWVA